MHKSKDWSLKLWFVSREREAIVKLFPSDLGSFREYSISDTSTWVNKNRIVHTLKSYTALMTTILYECMHYFAMYTVQYIKSYCTRTLCAATIRVYSYK